MPNFQCRAVDNSGQMVDKRIEAENETDARIQIESQGLTLVDIKTVSNLRMLLTSKKVTKKELSLFTKQLSQLVATGIALHRGVELIGEQTKNTFFKTTISKVVQDIKEGVPMSQSCAKHPNVFPESMSFQLEAAEAGGFMQEALMNISTTFERDAEFNSKVRGALIYPISVLVVALGIVYFMLATVVPSMSTTLASFDAELPGITLAVIALSDFVKGYWYIGAISGLVIGYFGYAAMQDSAKRRVIDSFLLKIPVLGNLIISINVARMTRVMSSLLSTGVPIDDTLENLKNVVSNTIMKDAVVEVKNNVVDKGISISKSMEIQKIFPRTMVQVVSVGEEAGNLPQVLTSMAETLEEEVSNLLKTLTSSLNPILMVIIGAIVATIILSLFLPMFALIDKF